jgi:hypothetical protein
MMHETRYRWLCCGIAEGREVKTDKPPRSLIERLLIMMQETED